MDCTDIKVILSGLVDDELDRDTRHVAERHLADCAACRELVSETERLNGMLIADARSLAPGGLPRDFEAAVLSRTVYAEGFKFGNRRWTTWLGWMAAAAVLAVSTVLTVVDRDRTIVQPGTGEVLVAGFSPYRTGTQMRSQVYDGDMTAMLASHVRSSEATTSRDQLSGVGAGAGPGAPMAMDDVDHVLTQASDLMQRLQTADASSYGEIEFIRRASASDELLRSLPGIRARLDERDRVPVLAAEFILMRIERGPLDHDDVRQMRDIVLKMELPRQLRAITDRATAAFSA
jgi:hypothetical protein